MTSGPKRLHQVYQYVLRIQAGDYAVVIGSSAEVRGGYRVVERPSRADRKEEEHAIIRQIEKNHLPGEARVKAWSERTGKSARTFYRPLAEMR